MPRRELTTTAKITTKSLVPHERGSKGGTGSSISLNVTGSDFVGYREVTAGQALKQGAAVSVLSDGKAYRAYQTISTGRPAEAVALNDAAVSGLVKIANIGYVTVPEASFTVGAPIYLTDDELNLTTSPAETEAGMYDQQIGIAFSSQIMQIGIGVAYEMV